MNRLEQITRFLDGFAEEIKARTDLTEAQAERVAVCAVGALLGALYSIREDEAVQATGEVAPAIKAAIHRAYHPGKDFVLASMQA